MNNKILKNFLLSFAIGCVVFGVSGYAFRTYRYVSAASDGEITKTMFEKIGEEIVIKTTLINYDMAILLGAISFGISYIILSLLKKDKHIIS
jgi:hypothetical protein